MKSFRLFVSSTFEDMRPEREALHAGVFRSIADYCAARGARFQAIDLRWGISDSDSRERRTMRICLDEMRRACERSPRLYLLVLLGNRYGWRPLPWRIPAVDFELLAAAAGPRRAALSAWYERDDNAVPAEYRLRDKPRGAKAPPEDELRVILDDTLRACMPHGDPRWVDYAGSAVHQEVNAARSHAGDPGGALCYVREPRPAPEGGLPNLSLDALEQELRGWLGPSVSSYAAAPTLEPFCQAIERALKARVDAALAEPTLPDLDTEIGAHAQFASERMRGFQGRRAARQRVQGYLASESSRPLVVVGEAGSGKSALMAQCAADARAGSPAAVVVQRFVGATSSSSDLRALLDGVREEVARAFGNAPAPPAHDVETAIPRWTEALGAGHEERPLIVFLDAVDQVEHRDGVDLVDWLPRELPPRAKVVASLADSNALPQALTRDNRGALRLSGLSWTEARNALRAWMKSAHRTLQPPQERAIRDRLASCPLPLFLKLSFEQARGWTSGDRRARVARGLDGIVDAALDEFEASHGRELVGHALRYLGAARFGLAEEEMVSVLGQQRAVLSELRRRSPKSPRTDELPVAIWARLHADLAPYLAHRTGAGAGLLGFYHRVVGERAGGRYASTAAARRSHRELAIFFCGRPVLRATDDSGETADARTAAEMPFHLTQARMWKELGQTLRDLEFVRGKCMAGMVHDLVNDYEAALGAGAGKPLAASLEQFLAFVRRDAHNLGRYARMPAFLAQQAHNFRRSGPVRAASAASAGDRSAAPWFKRLNVPDRNPELQATMTRHTASVLDCVFTPDGLRLVSCGNDGAIRMWTPDRWAHVKRIAQLPGKARSCDAAPDGSFLVSAGDDGVIRRHDLGSNQIREFRERVPAVERCRVSPDGDFVLACGEKGAVLFDAAGRKRWSHQGVYYDAAFRGDGVVVLAGETIQLVDVRTGKKAGSAGVQVQTLYGCAFSPDRRTLLVAGGNDTALYEHRRAGMAWTIDAGTMEASYEATHEFPDSALSCRFLPGGREYAIGLRSGSLLIFRTADGQQLRGLGDHTDAVRGMAIAPDGRHLVTASLDNRLHAYACSDLRTAAEAPPGAAAFCAFASGGREARVWHARPENLRMDFGDTVCRFDSPDEGPAYQRLDRDVGFGDVRIAGPGVAFNEVSGVFLPAVDGGRHHTPHRTSPAFGRSAEAYWLFAVGSRMTSFDLHLLPPLEDGRQHSRAVTWARSEDKWRHAVLRRDALVVYRDDTKQRAELETPPMPHRGGPTPACFFSTGGRRLFFTAEHAIAVVDTERLRLERLLDCGADTPLAFCESADRRRLLGGGAGGTLWEWDLDTGALRWQHEAHEGPVADCAYFDETGAMSIGEDRTLCLWTPGSARPLAVYCADAAISAFAIGADRRFVAAGDAHGGIHMLELVRPADPAGDDAAARVDPWTPAASSLAGPERMVHDVIAPRLAAAAPPLDIVVLCAFRNPPAEPEEWQLTVAGELVRIQRDVLPPVDVIIKASIEDWRLILTGELPVTFELFGSRPSVSGALGSIMKVLPALFPSAREE